MSYVGDARQETILARRTLRLAKLWKITRADGDIILLTDHNRVVTFDGSTYTPVNGVKVTAIEARAGLASSGGEVSGVIDSSVFVENDLAAGLYDDAKVEECVVDWRYPDIVGALLKKTFWISEVEFGNDMWDAKVVTVAARLSKRAGDVCSTTCNNQLGHGQCLNATGTGIDLEDVAWNRTTAVATVTSRNRFTVGSLAAAAFLFRNGKLVWTSGANTGFVSDVKIYDNATEEFILYVPAPNTIQVGDTCKVYAGCIKTRGECKNKFNNIKNFRGAPDLPGTADAVGIEV